MAERERIATKRNELRKLRQMSQYVGCHRAALPLTTCYATQYAPRLAHGMGARRPFEDPIKRHILLFFTRSGTLQHTSSMWKSSIVALGSWMGCHHVSIISATWHRSPIPSNILCYLLPHLASASCSLSGAPASSLRSGAQCSWLVAGSFLSDKRRTKQTYQPRRARRGGLCSPRHSYLTNRCTSPIF